MKLLKNLSILILAAAINYGCSSSNSGTPTTTTPNGIYSGSISGGNASFNGNEKAIVYNNKLIVLSSTSNNIIQIFDSVLTLDNNNITTELYRYNNTSPLISTLTTTGSFVENTSLTVSFIDTATPKIIPDGTISLTANTALYNIASSLNTVTKTWTGTHGGIVQTTTLTIDAQGAITGSDDSGCTIAGSISPADTSINVYNITLTYSICSGFAVPPSGSYSGLAWVENNSLILSVSDNNFARAMILL